MCAAPPMADMQPAEVVTAQAAAPIAPDEGDGRLRLENQLCFPLYACARRIVGLYTPLLKPLGITYTQYLVFLALWEYGEMPVGELGRLLYLDCGTLSPLLKRLEELRYIDRTRSDADERVVIVSLTESGTALKARAQAVPVAMGACIPLSLQESVQLHGLLNKLLRQSQ